MLELFEEDAVVYNIFIKFKVAFLVSITFIIDNLEDGFTPKRFLLMLDFLDQITKHHDLFLDRTLELLNVSLEGREINCGVQLQKPLLYLVKVLQAACGEIVSRLDDLTFIRLALELDLVELGSIDFSDVLEVMS